MKPYNNRDNNDEIDEIMIEKDPSTYTLLTYFWVIGLSMWGGVVSFYRKVKTGQVRAFNFVELVGELVTAAFIGVLTFWLCEAAGFSPLITAACVGVSGHMGSRGVFALELFMAKKLGLNLPEDTK